MCSVSVITQWGRDLQNTIPYQDPQPVPAPVPYPWTRDSFDGFKEILRLLDALDKKLGLAECEDPKKAEWMKAVEERLKALEGVKTGA